MGSGFDKTADEEVPEKGIGGREEGRIGSSRREEGEASPREAKLGVAASKGDGEDKVVGVVAEDGGVKGLQDSERSGAPDGCGK